MFSVDCSTRLALRNFVFLDIGNRHWLPFLQLHIYLLFLLGASIVWYQLIPLVYFSAAIILLALFCRALCGTTLKGIAFSTLITCLLLELPISLHFNSELYQEPLLYALLLGALYVHWYLPERKRLLFALCAVAMLTREYAWFYLAVIYAVQRAKGLYSQRLARFCFALAFIPLIWTASLKFSLLTSAQGKNLFALLNLQQSPAHFAIIFSEIRADVLDYLCGGLVVAVIALFLRYYKQTPNSSALSRFTEYSIISAVALLLIFGYMVLLAITIRSGRIVLPLEWHLPLWFALAFSASERLDSRMWKNGLQVWLAGLMLVPVLIFLPDKISQVNFSQRRYIQPLRLAIASFGEVSSSRGGSAPKLGIVDIKYDTFVRFILGPLIQFNPYRLRMDAPLEVFDILLVPKNTTVDGFSVRRTLQLPNDEQIDVLFRV